MSSEGQEALRAVMARIEEIKQYVTTLEREKGEMQQQLADLTKRAEEADGKLVENIQVEIDNTRKDWKRYQQGSAFRARQDYKVARLFRRCQSQRSRANKALARVAELEEVLQRWLSLHEEPCRLDHHANCQSHFLEPYCIVARTRNALAAKTEPLTGETNAV